MGDFVDRHRRLVILGLLLIIAGGLAILYARWPRDTVTLKVAAGASARSTTTSRSFPIVLTPDPRQQTVKVYIAGAVASPGVYTMRDGDRVDDAIAAAGGPTADADLAKLNLAQRLRDEGYIFVPRLGETPVAAAAATPGRTATAGGVININAATAKQLEALPGIGATYAKRIVDYRTQNGPYQRTRDLVDFKLVPAATFDKIKGLIDIK